MSKISSKRTILTSFLVDLGYIALNVTAMIITGSVVLLAEALEGGSDLVASGLLFVGSSPSVPWAALLLLAIRSILSGGFGVQLDVSVPSNMSCAS
jgi:hypothetical protein